MIKTMTWFSTFLVTLVLPFTLWAQTPADGKLYFVLARSDGTGFIRVEVEEKGGVYNGKVTTTSGFGPVGAQLSADQLDVFLDRHYTLRYKATARNESLNEVYQGFYSDNRSATFKAYTNFKKQTMNIEFEVGDVRGRYVAGKRNFSMRWENLELSVNKIKNEPGACKGHLTPHMSTEHLIDFFCESSGSLEDALFKRSVDVVAWLMFWLV